MINNSSIAGVERYVGVQYSPLFRVTWRHNGVIVKSLNMDEKSGFDLSLNNFLSRTQAYFESWVKLFGLPLAIPKTLREL